MQERIFAYTGQKKAFLQAVATFGLAILLEGSLIVLLIMLLVHALLWKLAALGVLSLFLGFMVFGVLLAPLWTRHRLSHDTLYLRYGRSFRVAIPCTMIRSAQSVDERLSLLQPLGVAYDSRRQRVTACFSEHGQVLLQLTQLARFKIGTGKHTANTLLINVDQREAFLVALQPGRPQGCAPTMDERASEAPPYHRRGTSSRSPGATTQPEASVTTGRQDEKVPVSQVALKTQPGEEIAIRIEQLTRSFRNLTVVNHLSLSIRRGEIYGFLGSNGAGKTTTIKMLVGLLQPDEGHVWMAGYDVWKKPLAAKQMIGYVPDRSLLYERLTGHELLAFLGQVRGLPQVEMQERIATLLDLLELTEYANRLCGSYSFGMKRKLSLAGALLHRPTILILDEPLNGLDPRSARRVKDVLLSLAAQGTTILLSTHDLATAEALCHRVGIIHRGRLLVEGSTKTLRDLASAPDLETVFLNLTAEHAEQEEEVLS